MAFKLCSSKAAELAIQHRMLWSPLPPAGVSFICHFSLSFYHSIEVFVSCFGSVLE